MPREDERDIERAAVPVGTHRLQSFVAVLQVGVVGAAARLARRLVDGLNELQKVPTSRKLPRVRDLRIADSHGNVCAWTYNWILAEAGERAAQER